jgi:hypothetical protein
MSARTTLAVITLAAASAAAAPPVADARDCADVVLDDWSDGRIDGTYSPACYRSALAGLPEDVRTYSSAPDDITRALRAAITAPARSQSSSGAGDSTRTLSGRTGSGTRTAAAAVPAAAGSARLPLVPILLAVMMTTVGLGALASVLAERRRFSRLARHVVGPSGRLDDDL